MYRVACSSTKFSTKIPWWYRYTVYSCEATGASSADEVRILIFDDSTEQEDWQSPLVETKLSNPRGTRSMGCMHEENLRNPAREDRAHAMRWFCISQVNSILEISLLIFEFKFSMDRC